MEYINYSNVFFLENYLRDDGWQDREFIFDLLKDVVFYSGGRELERISNEERNIFKELVGDAWVDSYFDISIEAKNHLIGLLTINSLIFCYEMPEWMKSFLNERKIDYIDIRLSPVRCSLDMMIAVRSNNDTINSVLSKNKIKKRDIEMFTTQVAASVRREQRYAQTDYKRFKNSLVFVGQTRNDAALIAPNGKVLNVGDYSFQLKAKSKEYDKIFYHAHPFAGEHANSEIQALEKIMGKMVVLSNVNTYDLLACDKNITYIGISSGLLQEAEIFGGKCEFLYQPICQIDGDFAYSQYYVDDIMNHCLWRSIFYNDVSIFTRSPGRENHLRKLHKLWFAHDVYMYQREPGADFFQSRMGGYEQRLKEVEIFIKKITDNRFFKIIQAIRKIL